MREDERESPAVAARSFWSGTITFGLVSIPVSFYAGARPRQKSMKMVDPQGHPLGRRYVHSETGKPLSREEIVRGFETEDGKVVVVTDEELASAAPETSRDIELASFVPLAQIPPAYFVRPYFLAPDARAGKAYTLLAQTMERTGKVGLGRFVMRGHEYLCAIIAEGGMLRAETLRYADELRTPQAVGLPEPAAPASKQVKAFGAEIDRLHEKRLGIEELEDREAQALHALAERKLKQHQDVIEEPGAAEDEQQEEGSAEIIDLVQLLRRSLAGASTPAPPPPRKARAEPNGDLDGKSREALYDMAGELGIAGRSRMKKAELLAAVRKASRRAAVA